MYGFVIFYSAHIYDMRVHKRLEYVPLYASATAGQDRSYLQSSLHILMLHRNFRFNKLQLTWSLQISSRSIQA